MPSIGTAVALVSVLGLAGVIAFNMYQNDGSSSSGPDAIDDTSILPSGRDSTIIYALDNDFDKRGSGLSLLSVSDPEHGSATINGDSSIMYTLDDPAYVGDDVFGYVIRDGDNGTDSAKITISIGGSQLPEVTQTLPGGGTPPPEDQATQLPGGVQPEPSPSVTTPPPQDGQPLTGGQLPIADAGESMTYDEGTFVILKGTGSYDPDGDALTYSWTQVDGPAVRLSDPSSVTPSFLAPDLDPQSGSIRLVFKLTVSDGLSGSGTDTVQINVQDITDSNSSPEADAGDDMNATEGSIVTLDGTGSSDPDGDELTYSWTQDDGPMVDSFTSTSASPTFRTPSIENESVILTFKLIVDDGNGLSDSDTVVVAVQKATSNQAPLADAGLSQRVEQNSTVILNGSGSYDPDGTPLAFSWNQTSGPAVSLNNVSSAQPTFASPSVTQTEQLVFELTVSDGNLVATDAVDIFVNPPTASHMLLATPDYMNDVASEIANAKYSVHAAMYFAEPYDGNKVIDELVKAVDRGVDVKLTFDNETILLYPMVESDMEALGIPYKVVSNHAKVVVIDNSILYVGSANWNDNGLENNWELNLKTTDPETVKEASQFVDALWNTGAKKVDYTDTGSERFLNGPEFYNLLLEDLHLAQNVKILMYQVSYSPLDPGAPDSRLLEELKDMNTRGADIQLLLDDPGYYERYNGRHFLVENGIPHRLDGQNTGYLERMHAKGILIDDKILFIGSQNWNFESLDSAQEASIVTSDQQTINDFLNIFNEKWDAGHEPA